MVSPVSSPTVLADMNQDWYKQLEAWQDIFAGKVVQDEVLASLFPNWERFIQLTIKIIQTPEDSRLQFKQAAEEFCDSLCHEFDIERINISKLKSPVYFKAALQQIIQGQPNPLAAIDNPGSKESYRFSQLVTWSKGLKLAHVPEYFRLKRNAADNTNTQLSTLLNVFGSEEVINWSSQLSVEQLPSYLKLLRWTAKQPYRKILLPLLVTQFGISEVVNQHQQVNNPLANFRDSIAGCLKGEVSRLHALEMLPRQSHLTVKKGELEKIKNLLRHTLERKLPFLGKDKSVEVADALCKFHPLGYMAINDEFTNAIEAYMAKILHFNQDLTFYEQLINELDNYRKAKLAIEQSPDVEVQKAQARIASDASEELINLILNHSHADYQDEFSESIQKNVVNKLEQEIKDVSSYNSWADDGHAVEEYRNALIACKQEVEQHLGNYKQKALAIKLKSLANRDIKQEEEIEQLEQETQEEMVRGKMHELTDLQININQSILKTLRDKLSAYGERCLKLLSEISMQLYGPIELGNSSRNYASVSPVGSLRLSR